MAKTPWEMAEVGKEFSQQTALFAWAAMAHSFGPAAANDPDSYKVAGHAKLVQSGIPLGTWRELPQLKWLHAIKNQGHGDAIRGSRSQAEGVKAGVADVFLPVPRHFNRNDPGLGIWKCGLYIELKQEFTGKPSPVQLDFQTDMRAAGYACEVCHGWIAARETILRYLGVKA